MAKKLSAVLLSLLLAFSMSFIAIPSDEAYAANDLQSGKLSTQASYPYLTVSMVVKEYKFTGHEIKPSGTSKIKVVYHYRVWVSTGKNSGYWSYRTKNVTTSCSRSYKNNIEVGNATITCTYSGCSASTTFKIVKSDGIKGVYSKYTSSTKTKLKSPVSCKVQYGQSTDITKFILKTIKRSTISVTKTSGDPHFMLSGSGSLFDSNINKETQNYSLVSKSTPARGNYEVNVKARSIENKNTLATNFDLKFNVEVTKADLSRAVVTFHNKGEYAYTGETITPDPYVTLDGKLLIKGRDYDVSWGDNKNVGNKAYALITPCNDNADCNYKGSVKGYFTIYDTIKSMKLSKDTFTYKKNTERKPSITAVGKFSGNTLKSSDYSITYYRGSKKTKDLTSAGTITVKITGKAGYTGTKKAKYTIENRPSFKKTQEKNVSLGGKKKTSAAATYKITASSSNVSGSKLTFSNPTNVNKNISFNTKNGTATLKKGVKKGSYSMTVDVNVGATSTYKAFDVKGVKITFVVK